MSEAGPSEPVSVPLPEITVPGGVCHFVATPIGNLGDISERVRTALADADVVAGGSGDQPTVDHVDDGAERRRRPERHRRRLAGIGELQEGVLAARVAADVERESVPDHLLDEGEQLDTEVVVVQDTGRRCLPPVPVVGVGLLDAAEPLLDVPAGHLHGDAVGGRARVHDRL